MTTKALGSPAAAIEQLTRLVADWTCTPPSREEWDEAFGHAVELDPASQVEGSGSVGGE